MAKTTEVRESCREWDYAKNDRCNAPAICIFWGKLFPPEALGPRCEDCADRWVRPAFGVKEAIRQGWAIFDLRNLTRG